jgi:hypothetical protein
MTTKFRTTGPDVHHDLAPKVIKPQNAAPEGRVGVFNSKGQRVGHVGPHAGVSVVSKLLGGAPAETTKIKGKHAWQSTGPSRSSAVTRAAEQLRKQIRTDRGSVRSR